MDFASFLTKLSTKDNQALIQTIFEGYQAIFEYPHFLINEPVDLHVEDKINKEGNKSALSYIENIISELTNNTDIDIENGKPGEITHIDNPKEKLNENQMDFLMKILLNIKNQLTSRVQEELAIA